MMCGNTWMQEHEIEAQLNNHAESATVAMDEPVASTFVELHAIAWPAASPLRVHALGAFATG